MPILDRTGKRSIINHDKEMPFRLLIGWSGMGHRDLFFEVAMNG